MITMYTLLFCVAIVSAVAAEPALRCVTCERDTLEQCTKGKEAAEFDEHIEQCSSSLPYCEVTIQDRLEPDSEPELEDVTRGCVEHSRFECSTNDELRTCTATCQGDLCNDFEDAAARVTAHEKAEAEAEAEAKAKSRTVGIVVGVVLAVAVAAVAAAVVTWRFSVRRRKARDLKSSGETAQPLQSQPAA